LDGFRLREDIEPEVFGPMRREGSKEEALKLDVESYQVGMHANAGGAGDVAVEVAGGCEVVKA